MKVDVILLTYGEPPQPRFWHQWMYSTRILNKLTRLVAPIPKWAVPLIGAYRGYGRRKLWRERDYQSPLEPITQNQALALRRQLSGHHTDHEYQVHVAFEFRHPDLQDTLKKIDKQGTDALIFLPMYLPRSQFTTQICKRDYAAYVDENHSNLPHPHVLVFRPYLDELTSIMASHIRSEIVQREITPVQCRQSALLLGCHGTVLEPPKHITESGLKDSVKAYELLRHKLDGEFKEISIGWLNHDLGGEWTSPSLPDAVTQLKESGITNFFYFPFGFVADNAESQLEGRICFHDLGLEDYIHLPCLNDTHAFMVFLARLIDNTASVWPQIHNPARAA